MAIAIFSALIIFSAVLIFSALIVLIRQCKSENGDLSTRVVILNVEGCVRRDRDHPGVRMYG